MLIPSAVQRRFSPLSRRRLLFDAGAGFGWVALSWLTQREALAGAAVRGADPTSRTGQVPHFAPRAKRVIQIFAVGGMSHVDTLDYKPELSRRNGTPFNMTTFFGQAGHLYGSPFEFRRNRESGLWVSSLLPHLRGCADKLTLIQSMVSNSANHMPAVAQMNTGFALSGFPSMGAWISYGLGTESEDLPAFVVLPDPADHPWGSGLQWGASFLPASHQGTPFRTSGDALADLTTPESVRPAQRSASLEWLARMNRIYQREHPGDSSLQARISSYELAARMQLSVPEIADIERESESTRRLYGLESKETEALGRRCLLARRLLERGVRFVQVYHGGTKKTWDAHSRLEKHHTKMALEYDRPVAGLLQDLDSRGMLEDTLVLGVTEFGRTPVAQGGSLGRDHHPECFTCWLAGAGLKRGFVYGASDELGYKPAENPVTIYDYHATVLHLLGIDHKRLTYYHNGIERRLTDVHGRAVTELLA